MPQFYRYWEHSQQQRNDFLSKYAEETLAVIPYWGEDFVWAAGSFQVRPDAAISQLLGWAREKGKVLSFYIPLTPCPLLPSGGLPLQTNKLALSEHGLAMVTVKADGGLNHIHTAFDSQTLKMYYSWIKSLKDLCDEQSVGVHWWGLESYYPYRLYFQSFLQDRSEVFEKSFTRYIKSNGLEDEAEMFKEKGNFQKLIADYYRASLEDAVGIDEVASSKRCFLKGSPETILGSGLSVDDELSDLSLDFCRSFTYGMEADFSLIPNSQIPDDSWKFFEHISPQTDRVRDRFMGKQGGRYEPLVLFNLWGNGELSSIEERANSSKLTTFFFNFFRWTYQVKSDHDFNQDDQGQITLCLQEKFKDDEVKKIAQAFSKGQKIIAFRESFTGEQEEFWKQFINQNEYFSELMYYHGKISYFGNQQGGQMIILSHNSLERLGVNSSVELWEKLVEFFDLSAFKIRHSRGVNYFWQRRDVRSHELSYAEVRRVFIHNASGDQQRVQIPKIKNGSLIKVDHKLYADVSTDEEKIWIEIDAYGMVSLEFGIIE